MEKDKQKQNLIIFMTGSPKPNFYDLYKLVGTIEGRLNTIEANLGKIVANHEERINCVEKVCDNMAGKASVIGAVVGFCGGIVASVLTFFFTNRS